VSDLAYGASDIVALMKPGQGYEARRLSEKLGVSTADLRIALAFAVQRGVIEQTGVRKTIRYWLPKPRAVAPAMKPLTISREMRAAQERCQELRVHPSRFGK
jgi:Leu/Phe-tRNA-protein transferase